MKIALCLYGVVGGKRGKAGDDPASLEVLKLGHEKYKSSLFDNYDVDVYLHTWSQEYEKEILDIYKPKAHIIEEQERFSIPDHIIGDNSEQPNRRQNHFSRWRSTQKVLRLKSESKEAYDFTLVSRFDIGFEKPIDFSSLDPECIYLSNWVGASYNGVSDVFEDGRGVYYEKEREIDKGKMHLYGRGYPHNHEGVMDLWMMGGEDTIKIFENLFDNISLYQIPGNVPNAPGISNHQLLLYHIRKNNLIDKLKFITNPMEDHCVLRYKYFGCKDSDISTLLRSK